jgi:hypothetical protein
MTDAERIAKLEERVERLETVASRLLSVASGEGRMEQSPGGLTFWTYPNEHENAIEHFFPMEMFPSRVFYLETDS